MPLEVSFYQNYVIALRLIRLALAQREYLQSKSLAEESKIPKILTLYNFKTYKDYKMARQVRSSCMLLLVALRILSYVIVVKQKCCEVGSHLPLPILVVPESGSDNSC